MFLLADEKKAKPRLGELSRLRQQELDCTCPVCTVIVSRFPVLLNQIFTHWLRASFGLKGGRMQQVFSAEGNYSGRGRSLVPALGTLSSQLMSMSEIHGL